MTRPTLSEVKWDLFWAKVDQRGPAECWPWIGAINQQGYGSHRMKRNGERYHFQPHRLAFEYHHGTVSPDLVMDHLCRVRHCCNPAHLEPVTNAENIRRGETGQHTSPACRNGHPYTEGSFTLRAGRWRQCHICARERRRRYEDRLSA